MKIDVSLPARLLSLITVLPGALNAGHLFVPKLIYTSNPFVAQAQRRLQASRTS